MKSKALYFNLKRPFISKALIIENLRKLWPLCLLLFLMYFIPICFIALVSNEGKSFAVSYANACLSNYNPVFIMALVIFPILASITVFKYLHKAGSTTVTHAMPFTRASLFFSNYLSGIIVLIVPIILNGIIMIPFMRGLAAFAKTHKESDYYDVSFDQYFEPFSMLHILNWVMVSILIMSFVYTMSVLAGMVSGNIPLHFINAVLFNFAPIVVFYITCSYLSIELFGFSFVNLVEEGVPWFSPLVSHEGVVEPARFIFFVFIIIMGIFLTNFLYGKRKSENAGNSLVFKFMEPVVVFLITFMGVSIVGMYAYILNETSNNIFYISIAASSLVTLIIANMIVRKSPRIFNKNTLLNTVVYVVIATVFMTAVVFDVLGLEKKVPPTDKINSVTLNSSSFTKRPYTDLSYFSEEDPFGSGIKLKSAEAVRYISGFHKDIVNDKKLIRQYNFSSYYEGDVDMTDFDMGIRYDLKSGNLNRSYNFQNTDFSHNKNLLGLIATDEFKNEMSLAKFSYDKITDININIGYVSDISQVGKDGSDVEYEYTRYDQTLSFKGEEKTELLKLLDKDFKEQSPEDLMNATAPLVELEILFAKGAVFDEDSSIHYAVSESYDHTLKWLKKKDYYDKLIFTSDDVEKLNIEIVKNGKVIDEYEVTDRKEILKLWNNRSADFNLKKESVPYAVLTVIYNENAQNRLNYFKDEDRDIDYGRSSIDVYLADEDNVNRFYIEKGNDIYKELIE